MLLLSHPQTIEDFRYLWVGLDALHRLQMYDGVLRTALVRQQHTQLGMRQSSQPFIRPQLQYGFVLFDGIGNAARKLRQAARQAKVRLREAGAGCGWRLQK